MIQNFVLIVGAMKSATTTIFDLLSEHPEIAPAKDKEPGFFAFPERYQKGWSWYESLFNFNPDIHKWAMEASTDYTKYPFCQSVPQRINQSSGRKFKYIYMMRHPIRRMESHAHHVAKTRKELGQYICDRPSHSLEFGPSSVSIAISKYAAQLDQYQPAFLQGDMLLLVLEEFQKNPETQLHRIRQFLGLCDFTKNGKGRVSNPQSTKKKDHPLIRWAENHPKLWTSIKKSTPTTFRRTLRKNMQQDIVTPGRFFLTHSEEQNLLHELRPDLVKLRDIYGIDVEGLWDISL